MQKYKEAEGSIDKLIEVMMAQIGEFQAVEKKLKGYCNSCGGRDDDVSEESFKGKETLMYTVGRRSEANELGKCLDLIGDRLTFLVVDYDKSQVRGEIEELRALETTRMPNQANEVLSLV